MKESEECILLLLGGMFCIGLLYPFAPTYSSSLMLPRSVFCVRDFSTFESRVFQCPSFIVLSTSPF